MKTKRSITFNRDIIKGEIKLGYFYLERSGREIWRESIQSYIAIGSPAWIHLLKGGQEGSQTGKIKIFKYKFRLNFLRFGQWKKKVQTGSNSHLRHFRLHRRQYSSQIGQRQIFNCHQPRQRIRLGQFKLSSQVEIEAGNTEISQGLLAISFKSKFNIGKPELPEHQALSNQL